MLNCVSAMKERERERESAAGLWEFMQKAAAKLGISPVTL